MSAERGPCGELGTDAEARRGAVSLACRRRGELDAGAEKRGEAP